MSSTSPLIWVPDDDDMQNWQQVFVAAEIAPQTIVLLGNDRVYELTRSTKTIQDLIDEEAAERA